MDIGTNVAGKMVTALKNLGFDRVFDTNTGADFTIMEEANEFIDRDTMQYHTGHNYNNPVDFFTALGFEKVLENPFIYEEKSYTCINHQISIMSIFYP